MRAVFATALLGAILLSGCSQTKTVSVLGMKWEIGQHQDCVYKAGNLYCIPANSPNVVGLPQRGWKDKAGKPVEMKRSELLFMQSVMLTHRVEANRAEALKEKDAETGTYDTKFSTGPVDYSIWDCLKTGVASPGISCTLTRKPSGDKDMQFIANKEQEEQLNDSFKELTMDGLQTKCGPPANTTSDSISRSLIYTPASGVPIAFRFETFGEHNPIMLDSAESQEAKDDPKVPRKIFWWKSASSAHQAGILVKEMPCLK
jgi:hypothetical protein